jgi:hypothetical protein
MQLPRTWTILVYYVAKITKETKGLQSTKFLDIIERIPPLDLGVGV